jgi:archaemetzincin
VAGPYPELEQKLRPLANPLPPPRPGDWLAEHDEPGQTFAEYLDARPVRKSDKLHTIYLFLVGDFTEAQRRILDLTEDYLALFFDCPVKVLHPARSSGAGAARRRPGVPGADGLGPVAWEGRWRRWPPANRRALP